MTSVARRMRPDAAWSGPSLGDVIAGVSVALVLVPQSLAYADLAGLPPRIGLFAAALPPLLAAWFASCPWLQTGPVALTALLTFGALSPLAEAGSPEFVAKASQLALVVGVTRGLLGVFRLGGIAYLLSEPVVVGFTTAAAVVIASSQVPKILGSDVGTSGNVLVAAIQSLAAPGEWNWTSIGIAVFTLLVVVLGRRLSTFFPGVLVAVIACTVWSALVGFGGDTVGELPGDLPTLALPDMAGFGSVLFPGFVIAFVGFAEPTSIARTLCASERRPWSASRELIGSCVANTSSAISGAFPVGGSFSRSSLNHAAGATSSWSGAVTGLVVFCTLPLVPVLSDLPDATLGAIIVSAVYRLVRVPDLVAIIRRMPTEGVLALTTLVATLWTSPRVDRGILLGVVLSVAFALSSGNLRRRGPIALTVSADPGHLRLAVKGIVWFFTVPGLVERMRSAVEEAAPEQAVQIDLGEVEQIDETGAGLLSRFIEDVEIGGRTVSIVGSASDVERQLAAHT